MNKIPSTITFCKDGSSVKCSRITDALDSSWDNSTLYGLYGVTPILLGAPQGYIPEIRSSNEIGWYPKKELLQITAQIQDGKFHFCHSYHGFDVSMHAVSWNTSANAYEVVGCSEQWLALYKPSAGKMSDRQQRVEMARQERKERNLQKWESQRVKQEARDVKQSLQWKKEFAASDAKWNAKKAREAQLEQARLDMPLWH